jgi:7-carboxy-7-deazaguanine synthase
MATSVSEPVALFPVVECFGPVVQGEGVMVGRKTHFVRFGGCDYRCTWCDTMYAVLPSEVRKNAKPMTAPAIVEALADLGLSGATRWVTLSGGNPALFDLGDLTERLHARLYRVAVETQGSKYKDWLSQVDCLTISPKPPSAGQQLKQQGLFWEDMDRIVTCNPNSNMKVVVANEEDFRFAVNVRRAYPKIPMTVQPMNLVGVDTFDTLMEKYRWLADLTMAEYTMAEVMVLPQLHVLAYSNERGK